MVRREPVCIYLPFKGEALARITRRGLTSIISRTFYTTKLRILIKSCPGVLLPFWKTKFLVYFLPTHSHVPVWQITLAVRQGDRRNIIVSTPLQGRELEQSNHPITQFSQRQISNAVNVTQAFPVLYKIDVNSLGRHCDAVLRWYEK